MSASRYTVRGGRVVLPDGVEDLDLVVSDGRVERLSPRGEEPPGEADVDATGRLVMAGMIDTHVHLRDPGHPHRETFASGTAAAARGGITTVLEMPSGIPPVGDAESWRFKRDLVAPKAVVDFGLYGGAGATNLDRIAEQAEAGAIAFKSFMTPPGATSDPGIETRTLADDASLLRGMRAIAEAGALSVVHAENGSMCTHFAAELRAAGRDDLAAHAAARPPIAEEEAAARALVFAAETGVRLSFAHVSTAGAVARIRRAKAEGLPVTAEACPHHLLLGTAEMLEKGPFGKINPPLRDAENRAALWEGVADGTIDFIGTDHAPYTAADKEPGRERIWDAPSGGHGLEAAVRVLLTEVHRGRLTLPRLTRLISLRAAQVFGLHPRKGELRAGFDADFMIVDPEREGVIDGRDSVSVSRDGALLWDGYPAVGAVTAAFVRGVRVADEGRVVGGQGFGSLVTPRYGASGGSGS